MNGFDDDVHVAGPLSQGSDGLIRVAFWVGQLARVLTLIQSAAAVCRIAVSIGGSAGGGVLEIKTSVSSAPAAVAQFVAGLRAGLKQLSARTAVPSEASAVVVYAPDEVRDPVDMWGLVPSLGQMHAIKDQFDPGNGMAPCRLG